MSIAPKHRPPPGPIKLLNELESCDVAITPICIKFLYQVPPNLRKPNPANSLGIFEEGDYYAQEDLDLFFRNFTPYIPQGTHPIPAFIDGAEAPVPVVDAGGESDLDFELAYPLIYPQTVTLYQTDDIFYATNVSTSTGGFNTFLDALDGVSSILWKLLGQLTKSKGVDSLTAHTQRLAKVEMIRSLIRSILIPILLDTRDLSSAVSTSLLM